MAICHRKTRFIIVYTTFPDLKSAKKIVRDLVHNRLCACGNIFRLHSIYHWRGKVEEAAEYGALLKTTVPKYAQLERGLRAQHPYEVPAIVSWCLERGAPAYLKWLAGTVGARRSRYQ